MGEQSNVGPTLKLVREQCNGVCQLCGSHTDSLFCDHDHKTEIVRGFVCKMCNSVVIPDAENAGPASPKASRYLSNPPLAHLGIKYRVGRHKHREKIRVEPKVRVLAEKYGYTVSAIVRYCIEQQLPELERRLEKKYQSRPPAGQEAPNGSEGNRTIPV